MIKQIAQQLRTCRLFKDFSGQELEELLTSSNCRLIKEHKGSLLRVQGSTYRELLVLTSGRLNARFNDYSGKSMLVETLVAPTPIAAGILFSDMPSLPVTIEADTDVTLVELDRGLLLSCFRKSETMLLEYLEDMGSKLSFLAEKVRLASMASLRQKIADYLLRMRESKRDDEFTLPYTREKMAELFSVARPSLSREFSRMSEDGLLELDGPYIRLTDVQGLQEELEP